MKNKIIFFVLLFFPFWISAQSELNTDILIQRMKLDYQEWLSKRDVKDLLVEYDASPVALDTPNPRFSWIMDLKGRGSMQTAYQILVASDRKTLDAGTGEFTIKPFVPENDLDWVNASVHTIHGTITSAWEKKPGEIIFEIKVPANTSATIHLPAGPGAVITESGKPVSGAEGIRTMPTAEGSAVFELGSGSYLFSVSERPQPK